MKAVGDKQAGVSRGLVLGGHLKDLLTFTLSTMEAVLHVL